MGACGVKDLVVSVIVYFNPRPAGGGGGQRAPCGFPQIALEVPNILL